MKRLVAVILILSFFLRPVGWVAPVFADTVQMEYTDPDHIYAPKRVNEVEYQYDSNGNLVNDGERVISWNLDNMPVKIVKDGIETNIFYDADGRRLVKKSGEDKTIYANNFYQRSTINNQQSVSQYYFANGKRIALSSSAPSAQLSFLHHDHLGSAVLATDSNSQPLDKAMAYFPYGNLIVNHQPSTINHLFTGQEFDPETDLYNYKARLYNPTTSAFLSADTVEGENRYSYAENNPLIFTDPNGHAVIVDGGGNLKYQISGAASKPLEISATGIINPADVVYTPYDISPAGKAFLVNMIMFSLQAPALIVAGISWLQFAYAYYYYNYFYTEPAVVQPAVHVGDVLQISAAAGYTSLARGMTDQEWERYYQALKTLVEEQGVHVYELPLEAFSVEVASRGLEAGGYPGAFYLPTKGLPGDIYLPSEFHPRLKVLYLGHDYKHFLQDWTAEFPGPKSALFKAVGEVDAYGFYLANTPLLIPDELSKARSFYEKELLKSKILLGIK